MHLHLHMQFAVDFYEAMNKVTRSCGTDVANFLKGSKKNDEKY